MTAAAQTATDAAAATPRAFPDPAAAARGHAELLKDASLQLDFPWHEVKRNPPPKWLVEIFEAIARFIAWVGSGWNWVFWIAAALIVAALLVALVPSLRAWALSVLRRGRSAAAPEPPRWAPQASAARRLLDDADRLAAEGRYDEAVHLILHRSIDDIHAWRGDLVRPSLTSRDIAGAEALPDAARAVFRRIVALVEASLFAGRGLSADDWSRARADYAGFALRAA